MDLLDIDDFSALPLPPIERCYPQRPRQRFGTYVPYPLPLPSESETYSLEEENGVIQGYGHVMVSTKP